MHAKESVHGQVRIFGVPLITWLTSATRSTTVKRVTRQVLGYPQACGLRCPIGQLPFYEGSTIVVSGTNIMTRENRRKHFFFDP